MEDESGRVHFGAGTNAERVRLANSRRARGALRLGILLLCVAILYAGLGASNLLVVVGLGNAGLVACPQTTRNMFLPTLQISAAMADVLLAYMLHGACGPLPPDSRATAGPTAAEHAQCAAHMFEYGAMFCGCAAGLVALPALSLAIAGAERKLAAKTQ